MGRRLLKKEILTLLSTHELDAILSKLVNYQTKQLLSPLFIALCNPIEKVRWYAVCCFGKIVPVLAEEDLEAARVVMRRFLWTLNDESGGIGWGAPESMAEIMCHHEQLRKEYLHMLISYMRQDGPELYQDGNYLELPLLQRGLLWGVGRLCQTVPEEMIDRKVDEDLVTYLHSGDLQVAGTAMWALSLLKCKFETTVITSLSGRGDSLKLFLNGDVQEIPFSELAYQLNGMQI